MNHSDACNRIRLEVSRMGGLVLEYKTGALKDEHGRLIRFGSPGASDLIACIGGRFIAIEVKLGRDAWRPEQQRFAAAVRAAGGLHVVARFSEVEDGVSCLLNALSQPASAGSTTASKPLAPAKSVAVSAKSGTVSMATKKSARSRGGRPRAATSSRRGRGGD